MLFVLQAMDDYKSMHVDYAILKELLEYSHFEHIEMKLSDFLNSEKKYKNKNEFAKELHDAIPLGTIDFVTAYLNIFKGIEQMNPIEIPKCLRTDEFLKRKYMIVSGKDVPQKGSFFIKNVSKLKTFSYLGEIRDMNNDFDETIGQKPINKDTLYQVSEIINIKSEYRVYVVGGEVYAIAYYDGDALLFPDTKLIQKANLIYSMQKDYPKSYTMDVAISDRGTSILEIHPMFSCGIYQTVLGPDFLYAYRDSMNYLINHNTKLTPDIN